MTRWLISISVVLIASFSSAGPKDEFWDRDFGSPGINGYGAGAIAVAGTNVFFGGSFTEIGGMTATNIARWNGTSWSPLGPGLGRGIIEGPVGLTFCAGFLYAGGVFTNAGSTHAINVAQWDGANWSGLGTGIPGVVTALSSDGSNIYFGGSFTTAGGIAATNVARWDGQRWWGLGNGVKGDVGGIGAVDAIAVGVDGIYVGGSFTNASGVNATNVARWDGSNWHALGSSVPNRVRSLAVIGRKVYAGGGPFRENVTNAVYLSEWNGMEWRAVGISTWPAVGSVQALAFSGNDLYVGGSFVEIGGIRASRIAKWDGTLWLPLGSGIGGSPNGGDGRGVLELECNGSEVFIGGYFQEAGGKSSTNIALWHIPHSLSISRTSDQVQVSWPATGTNFLLETKGDLDDTDWVEVSQPPDVLNEECIVTELMNATNRFYRLRRKPWW